MPTKNTTSRETKAQALLESGAVELYIGLGVATVQGSKGTIYHVSRGTGCDCPDRIRRDQPCKHELAVKQLCDEYHRLKLAAQRGEKVRPSRHLLQALRWPVKKTGGQGVQFAPHTGCRECGRPTQQDLCSDCLFYGAA